MLQLRKGKVVAHDNKTYLVVKRPIIGIPPKGYNEVAPDQEWIHDVFVANQWPIGKAERMTRFAAQLVGIGMLVFMFLQIGRWVHAGMPISY
jgi:hypothetical protein